MLWLVSCENLWANRCWILKFRGWASSPCEWCPCEGTFAVSSWGQRSSSWGQRSVTMFLLTSLDGKCDQRSSTTRCGNSYLALCNILFCGLKWVEDSRLPKFSMCRGIPFRRIEGSAQTCCYKPQSTDSPVENWRLRSVQLLHQSLGFLRMWDSFRSSRSLAHK